MGCGLAHIEIERISPNDYDIAAILLKRYKPKLFFGTPAGMLEMLKFSAMREALQSVEVTVIGGAISSNQDIALIEESIGCKVLDFIGSTELCIFGVKEAGCDGFHLTEPATVEMEIIEPDAHGNGKCIMTSLCNKRMPLVRYMTGDTGRLEKKCACGHEGTVFTMTGRIADTCCLGGTKVGSDCFEYVAKKLGFNTTFQALVYPHESPQRIQLNIVDKPAPWTMEQVLTAMMHVNVALRSKLSAGIVTFDIGFIEEEALIGLNARGKWRRILER